MEDIDECENYCTLIWSVYPVYADSVIEIPASILFQVGL